MVLKKVYINELKRIITILENHKGEDIERLELILTPKEYTGRYYWNEYKK